MAFGGEFGGPQRWRAVQLLHPLFPPWRALQQLCEDNSCNAAKWETEHRDAAAIVTTPNTSTPLTPPPPQHIHPPNTSTPQHNVRPRLQHKRTPRPYLLPRIIEQVVRVPTAASVGDAFAGAVVPARQE